MGSDWDVDTVNVFDPACPTRQVLDLIGDRWTVLIVLALTEQTMRFTELRKRLGDISPKVLTNVLRNLERDGLVDRKVFAEVPPRVEYSLTPLGHTLHAPLDALRDWAAHHVPDINHARQASSNPSRRN